MILTETRNEIETSPNVTGKKFSIAVNRKAFEMIASKLYSNKAMAVIREISTNAYDSHIAAGKHDEPFHVHLPNKFEPYFSVEDFGVGISPEKAETMYTTLFVSDKSESNEFTGMLGIGRVSCLIYGSRFTVITTYAGTRYNYVVYLDVDGIPNISLLHKEATDQCNGVKVMVDIPVPEISNFIEAAKQVYSVFRVKPVITGQNIKIDSPVYEIEGTEYGIHKGGNNSRVVMGNVAYPINLNSLGVSYDTLGKFLSHSVDLYVPIGTVDIVPSREALEYTTKTIETVKGAAQAALEDARVKFTQQIEQEESLWKVKLKISFLRKSQLGQALNINEVTWKGQKVTNRFVAGEIEIRRYERGYKRVQNCFRGYFEAEEGQIILWSQKCAEKKISRWMKDNRIDEVYEIISEDESVLAEQGLTPEYYKKVADLPKPSYKSNRKAHLVKINRFQPEVPNYSDSHLFWAADEVSLDDGGVYVVISNYKFHFRGGPQEPHYLKEIHELLAQLGHPTTIYASRPAYAKKLEESEDWTSLEDYIMDMVKEHEKEIALAWQYVDARYYVDSWLGLNTKKLSADSELLKFIQFCRDVKANSGLIEKPVFKLAQKMGFRPKFVSLEDYKEQIFKRYPMLKYINNFEYSVQARKDIINYVALCDKEPHVTTMVSADPDQEGQEKEVGATV